MKKKLVGDVIKNRMTNYIIPNLDNSFLNIFSHFFDLLFFLNFNIGLVAYIVQDVELSAKFELIRKHI